MTAAVLDSTIIVHLFRKLPVALTWFAAQNVTFSITSVTWMELMYGASSKRHQQDTVALLDSFQIEHLTVSDQEWAMQQMKEYRFSHGIAVMDCFIASVCHRLNVPIYTHNRKDFLKLLPAHLVITPY